MNVKLYIEGGGDAKIDDVRCREGFRKLLEKAGFQGRMPRTVASGGRSAAYGAFETAMAVRGDDDYPLLLVDSEDPVSTTEISPDSPAVWEHLAARDRWERPQGANNDQAQLMVTCMETWIMADREALAAVFGHGLRKSALLPENGLESRNRDEVQQALENATKDCGRQKAYRKGRRSFQVLAQLSPATLGRLLPHFERFVRTLDRHLALHR